MNCHETLVENVFVFLLLICFHFEICGVFVVSSMIILFKTNEKWNLLPVRNELRLCTYIVQLCFFYDFFLKNLL